MTARFSPAAPDTPALPRELAQRIGVRNEDTPDSVAPETMLDWALHWSDRGVHIFPCVRFLGRPLLPKWYEHATVSTALIVEWWSRWPNADIGAVPDRSCHYVIAAFKDEGGLHSLAGLESQYGELPAEIAYETGWGDEILWMKGEAYTSHHKLGLGLHVLGTGQRVFMPPSIAPHIIYRG
jgi:hypothetical protein